MSMNYVVERDCIYINGADTFDIESILTSGQLFRFGNTFDGQWWVASGDKYARISKTLEDSYVIHTSYPAYFVDFFDLNTDYGAILERLSHWPIMLPAIEFGHGVRLMHQPLCEVIISFIISANNNIPRIRKSVEYICEKFGSKTAWGYAFPTIEQLKLATADDFLRAGCGYRSSYLVDTISRLGSAEFVDSLYEAPNTKTAREILMTLEGVGNKVADCILLFGLGRYDVFPVDTWIDKVYHQDFGGSETSRSKIADWFVREFGFDSGYCQQYLFYYKRKDIKLK